MTILEIWGIIIYHTDLDLLRKSGILVCSVLTAEAIWLMFL